MEHSFWHNKWAKGQIGFHEGEVNPFLSAYLDRLALPAKSRIFVPLCGKSKDIEWLLSQGYDVVGAELDASAVNSLFAEMGHEPEVLEEVLEIGALTRYRYKNLDVWQGDIFALTADVLGDVAAIYDRAALVALPDDMRLTYAAHLIALTKGAPQLLVTCEYDQQRLSGPPFSVPHSHVERCYGDSDYEIECLLKSPVEGGFKGVETWDLVWLLSR